MKKQLVQAPIPQGPIAAPFNSNDASAIQSLSAGKANEGQQKHALEWILKHACALPLWPYRNCQRETDVALGRHFVGQQIMGLVHINLSALKQREERGERDGG